MGNPYADITDNHSGGSLGVEYGFAASVSLDSHPAKVRAMVEAAGIELTAFCAHANLLDPAAPDVYGTMDIIKAIRLAALLGIKHVITTEGDPKTEFGRSLTKQEKVFSICEKLHTPIQWAEERGVGLLLETHGEITDNVETMGEVLEKLGHEDSVGICLDTGNSWLGGAEPIDYVTTFGNRIKHVHWKDMSLDMEAKRGELFGCGMAVIPLGDGVIDIPAIVNGLKFSVPDGGTLVFMDHPENLNHPAKWFVSTKMSYFSPAVIHDGPHTMNAGETLSLKYRFVLSPTVLSEDTAAKRWKEWK